MRSAPAWCEHGIQRIAERLEIARDEAGGRKRREAPVLARRVVIIGRRADAGAGHGQRAVRPGGRAVRRDAHGEIQIEADAHAGGPRPRLRRAELPVGKPLQPRVKRHQLGLFLGESADGIGGGVAVFVGPAVPGGAVALLGHGLRKRLEQSVQIERLAAVQHELLEVRVVLVLRGVREDAEEHAERLRLEGADSAIVDHPGGAQLSRRLQRIGDALVERRLVEGDVERVQEAARGGREGAAALRRGEEERVQRVDADEIRARLRHELGEAGEILEIADAGIARRAQAVKLAGDAPAAALLQPIGDEAGNAVGRLHATQRDRGEPGKADGGFVFVAGRNAHGLQHAALGAVGDAMHLAGQGEVLDLDADGRGKAVELGHSGSGTKWVPSWMREMTASGGSLPS